MGRATVWHAIQNRLDGMIPADLAARMPTDLWRVRLAMRMSALLSVIFLIMVAIQAISGSGLAALISLAISLTVAAGPLLVRTTGRFTLALTTVIGTVFVGGGAGAALVYGAGLNAATVALAVTPVFATLLRGPRYGAIWAAICVAAGAGFGVAAHLGLLPTRAPELLLIDHAALAAATLVSFLIGVLYEAGRTQSLRELAMVEERRRSAERHRLAAEAEVVLARHERLASLGRMVAATAHEINNPLNFVIGNLELVGGALDELGADDETRAALRDALEGAQRIAGIVSDLKQCVRPGEVRLSSVDVVELVLAAIRMAEPHTRGRAAVRVDLEGVPSVVGTDRLVQVFLNLVVNAAQAIIPGRVADNEIMVTVERAGDQVVVSVRDTGPGMTPDVLARVKEPFFTTKDVGEGTGLGLAISDAIVQSAGGHLDLESSPAGTVARVVLLAAQPDEQRDRAVTPRTLASASAGAMAAAAANATSASARRRHPRPATA
jgi:signal transduction histidine kinase